MAWIHVVYLLNCGQPRWCTDQRMQVPHQWWRECWWCATLFIQWWGGMFTSTTIVWTRQQACGGNENLEHFIKCIQLDADQLKDLLTHTLFWKQSNAVLCYSISANSNTMAADIFITAVLVLYPSVTCWSNGSDKLVGPLPVSWLEKSVEQGPQVLLDCYSHFCNSCSLCSCDDELDLMGEMKIGTAEDKVKKLICWIPLIKWEFDCEVGEVGPCRAKKRSWEGAKTVEN